MIIDGQEIKNSTEYELQYLSLKKRAYRAVVIYSLIYFFMIIFSYFVDIIYSGNSWLIAFENIVFMLRVAFIKTFFYRSWHNNLREEDRKNAPFWWGIIVIIMLSFDLFYSIMLIVPCFILYFGMGTWLWLVYADILMLMLAVVPFLLYYWSKWLHIYRWTWAELQIPVQERKRIYRETKRIRKQEKRERRQKNIKNRIGKIKEAVNISHEDKLPKYQADQRTELENLKKLYEDGLIDEEDYKNAKEKTLNLK